MVRQTFSLHPFQPVQQQITVECAVHRDRDVLLLNYALDGNLEGVILPPRTLENAVGQRLDGLWQSTCFECFFKAGERSGYHELNVSPRGDWNLYSFDGYRSGMKEEAQVGSLQVTSSYAPAKYLVECCLHLGSLDLSNCLLQIGLSAVLAHPDGTKSYWALCHPGKQPDFHDDASFIVAI